MPYELPDYIPTLLPSGIYVGEVSGEITEAPSQFDKAKVFLKVPLLLKSQKGEWRSYTWPVGPATAMYGEFLKAIGGRPLQDGVIAHPKSFFKVPFIMELSDVESKKFPGQRVNKVVSVRRYQKTPKQEAAEPENEVPSEVEEEESEAAEGPLEDAPI